ncbi:prophage antirepressor-like protein [Arcanobacterium wilhelmae]|uniref:Prophage antirepressor-like protein n=1 Tax=Arcanobacterium wilhelmae TaxID=1803177 RepID=A0ABT9N8R2_9ACTO|nr:phage antirepressor KilAC domain-containing protein [Arcanobacterium wilhelmae]MDP9800097.1 prophage antirepressor-like protein [Arcanobacterium wilhelmae]
MATRDLQVFTNDAFGTIRTVEHEDKVYFCGRDVATALGYKDPTNAIKQHCKGVAIHHPLETAGGVQDTRFITEGDLYRLIFSSKLPAAQDFEAWVVDEVLPTIRRHGVYAIDELLDDDEFLEHAIIQLRSERAKRLAAEQALLEATPKVTYYDIVLQSPDAVPITLIAKDYGLSARKMNQLLHELGIQFKQSGVWVLYQAHAGNGYTDTKTHLVAEGRHTRLHTYWTQKGRLFIYEQLKNQRGILPSIEQDGGAA